MFASEHMMIVIIIFYILFTLIPGIVALTKQKKNWPKILLLGILVGWTIVGWILLLVWALMNDPVVEVQSRGYLEKLSVDTPKKECPSCKKKIDIDYSSCPSCGEKFSEESIRDYRNQEEAKYWTCRNCGQKNSVERLYCSGCGEYR